MRGNNGIGVGGDVRLRNLGEVRLEAEMMRGEVLAECIRGCSRLMDRVRRRRAGLPAAA
ncbi:hypothetical protein [Sediminicurvatus halobius]|uniref:hypothetical protein n=1 Tax=Sediminicurvatus halobius TaxID=2182432 RepID=UPI001304AD0A|nr:hypothetical protein [Spiribacter halobius]UEX78701.1 hypothetical protein LMH63_03380 [Spiribacter halobius]